MSDPQTFIGGPGNDVYTIDNSADQIIEQSNGGTDLANASVSYTLPANVENLTLTGTAALTGTGNELNNVIIANSGDDTLNGMAGDDTLIAGGGTDTLNGGDGNDLMIAGTGADTFSGGAGIDTVSFANASGSVVAYLNQGGFNGGAASGDVILDAENLIGSAFNDILHGDADNNVLTGGAGNDQLDGGAGDDVLIGGAGNDLLVGGSGNDTFLGTTAELNGDTILDFSPGDKIVISDATLAGFSFSITGNTLTYSGGSLTLSNGPPGHVVAQASAGGGVELVVEKVPHNDFNGDGRSDVFFQNTDGTVTDWLGRSDGTFTGNAGTFSINLGSAWHVAGTGDFNGDGRADVLFQNTDGTVTDWLGRADGSFTGNAATFSVNLGTAWHAVGTGDFNGDGRADVLFQNNDGTVTDWLGRSDGSFTGNAGTLSVNIGTAWHVVGTGDFNGDGRDDALFQNTDGTITDWLGRADGTFSGNAGTFSVNPGTQWHVVATGDFNGDHMTDVLLRSDSGIVNEWLGQSDGSFAVNTQVNNNVSTAWHAVGVGDYNGDGIDDVFWQNNDGTITDWLGRPDGTFAGNAFQFSANLGTTWHVQDPFVHDPIAFA